MEITIWRWAATPDHELALRSVWTPHHRGFGERGVARQLYQGFDCWQRAMATRPVGGEVFGRWFASLGFPKATINGYRYYDGPDRKAFLVAVLHKAGVV